LPAKRKFLGDEFFLVESTEPTNIIWENRHWTASDIAKRTCIAFTLIFILLMLSLCVIFYCEMYAIEVDSTYPTVDCDYIDEVYGEDNLEYWAYLEY
jgi:ABC-type multidrug transport system permease subunit